MSSSVNMASAVPSTNDHQRRSPRAHVDIPVQVFGPGITCCGRGYELGSFGMVVYVPIELKEGDTIRIMFQPPGSRMRFGLFGIVRNRDNFRYGIEFRELRPAENVEIERVVKELTGSVSAAS